MAPDPVPPSGGNEKRIVDNAQQHRNARKHRGGSGGTGSKEADLESGDRPPGGLTLRDMRATRGGGSEGLMKEPVDKELLQKIFEQKLHEKPEVRDALEGLMEAVECDAGVREAFVRLQDAAAKHISTDAEK